MKNEDISFLPPLVIKYLNYLSAIMNKSELTVLEYASDLRLFFCYIVSKQNNKSIPDDLTSLNISNISDDIIKQVTLESAYDFLSYCKNVRKNEVNTRGRKAVSIKRFYKYLETQRIIDDNPLKYLQSPSKKKALPKFLSLKDSENLLNAVNGINKERDFCILTLFLNCGMRLAELVSIDISDISFDTKTIRIVGKGNKMRIAYLNNSCILALKSYLAVRPKDNVKDRDALFLSNRLTRLSRESVQKMVCKYLKIIGLDNCGLSVHKLRHTAATLMYQYAGADMLELKELLGHENISTTEVYTHLDNKAIRKAVDNNPLNKQHSDE